MSFFIQLIEITFVDHYCVHCVLQKRCLNSLCCRLFNRRRTTIFSTHFSGGETHTSRRLWNRNMSETETATMSGSENGTKAEKVQVTAHSVNTSVNTSISDETYPGRNIAYQPPSRYHTTHNLDIDAYFQGPRDMNKHSKLPFFMRIHGSVLPKMILPLSFVAVWATAITLISQLVFPLSMPDRVQR